MIGTEQQCTGSIQKPKHLTEYSHRKQNGIRSNTGAGSGPFRGKFYKNTFKNSRTRLTMLFSMMDS
jgi:hypothetical protein